MNQNQTENKTEAETVQVWPQSSRPLPAGFSNEGFDGDIRFGEAFDQRAEGNGIGDMAIAFWLRRRRPDTGEVEGAVLWQLSTGCYLPSTQVQWLNRLNPNPNLNWNANHPTPGAVCWHSPVPLYESHVPQYDCQLLGPGLTCYQDAGYTIGDRAYEALVSGGESRLWEFMRTMYFNQFGLSKPDVPASQRTRVDVPELGITVTVSLGEEL